jgi:hypothetical protein
VRRLFPIAIVGVLGCGDPSGDVSATVRNPPQCTPGKGGLMEGLLNNVVVRVEVDGATRDLMLPGPNGLSNDWVGREATVRIGVCRAPDAPNPSGRGFCDDVPFLESHKTTLTGDRRHVIVEVPVAPIPCLDGSQATFGNGP